MKRTALRPGKPLARRSRLAPRRARPRRSERVRDTAYMLWVKTLPCFLGALVPGHVCEGPVEADHVGDRGLGQKSDDRLTIPLCRRAHRHRTDFAGAFRRFTQHDMRAFVARALADTAARYERAHPFPAADGRHEAM